MFAQRQYRMSELNWSRSLLIVFVHLMGVAALILILSGTVPPETMYLAILWYTIHGLSITAGDHRLYSHCSYKARWPLHALFFLTGPGAFQGVRIWWSGKHREHHAFDGSDRDPHTINRGFWFAHVLWLIHRTSEPPQIIVSDLNRNAFVWIGSQPWVYLVTGVTVGFIIPMVIAGWFWDDMVGALFVAGFLRLTLNWNVTWLVNSLAHFVGSRPYSLKDSARDTRWWGWIFTILSFGEFHWHNRHHRFPNDYRNGVRWYHIDITKWFIFTCSLLGLAYDLKCIPESEMEAVRHQVRIATAAV